MKHLKTYKIFENLEPKSFIWIHGLPGSGKTTLANKIINENPDKKYVLLDDVGSNNQIIEQIDKGSNIILSSPYFDNYTMFGFDRQISNYLSKTDYSVEELWFENNPQRCIENIKNRKGHHINVQSLLPEVINFSNNYKIPSDVEQIPVFSNEVTESFNEKLDWNLIQEMKDILLPFSDMDMKVTCDYIDNGKAIAFNVMGKKEKAFNINDYKDDIDALLSYMKENNWAIFNFSLGLVVEIENWSGKHLFPRNQNILSHPNGPLNYDKVSGRVFWITGEFRKVLYYTL